MKGGFHSEALERAVTGRTADPDLQHAVECLLWRVNDWRQCPVCKKTKPRSHTPDCPILALNTILNSRVSRAAPSTGSGDSLTRGSHQGSCDGSTMADGAEKPISSTSNSTSGQS